MAAIDKALEAVEIGTEADREAVDTGGEEANRNQVGIAAPIVAPKLPEEVAGVKATVANKVMAALGIQGKEATTEGTEYSDWTQIALHPPKNLW